MFAGLGKRGTSEVLEHCVFRGALCQASGAFLGGGKSALRQVTADLLDILRSHVGVVYGQYVSQKVILSARVWPEHERRGAGGLSETRTFGNLVEVSNRLL
ncbi:MAG: hypothetical protein AAFU82_08300 [Pseudomonadota bacterium]